MAIKSEVAIGVGGPAGDSTVPAPQAVVLDMSLFIRLLELSREDLKSDEQLHRVAQRVAELSAQKTSALTMNEYDSIAGVLQDAQTTDQGLVGEGEFVTYSGQQVQSVARLRALAALKENAGTVKDAALAIQQIFQRNSFPLTCRPMKGDKWDDPHVVAKGKTKFGPVEFAMYLTPNKKDLIIDYYQTDGLYGFMSILDDEAARFRTLVPESTKGYDIRRAERTSMAFAGAADRVSDGLSEAETVWGNFAAALQEIKDTMVQNAVPKK